MGPEAGQANDNRDGSLFGRPERPQPPLDGGPDERGTPNIFQPRPREAPTGGPGELREPFSAEATSGGGRSPRRRPASYGRTPTKAALIGLVLLAAAGVLVAVSGLFDGGTPVESDDSTPVPTSAAERDADAVRPEGWPPLAADVSSEPLGTPGPVPEGGGPHSFVARQRDGFTPVGYDPCRPIRYVTRPGGPSAGNQLIAEAVEMVSAATGLQFIDEGATEEAPSDAREPYQPDRYGERWAPVLISWSNPSESPALGAPTSVDSLVDVAGYAGSISVGLTSQDPRTGRSTDSGYVFVTGSVVLDEYILATTLDGADGPERARAVIAHELAHLVGLGHVDDPEQLMHPETRPEVTQFAPGDLQGLAHLGGLPCFPEI